MIVLTFMVYLLVMLGIGLWAYRRTDNLSDYILGGRSLGAFPSALSAGASDMSGWLLLGLPGYVYAAGLEAFWLGFGLFVGTWLNWQWVAPGLRTATKKANDSLTLPDYFGNRFHDRFLLRAISAVFILLFFTFYASSGLVAAGKLFVNVFEFDYFWAVTLGALAVMSYTMFGGYLAVAWTDMVQGLLMVAALVLVPLVVFQALDQSPTDILHNANPFLLDIWTNAKGEALGAVAIVSLLAWGLGYFGQPHILARFMAIESREAVAPARRIAVTWTAIGLIGAFLVGVAGLGYFAEPLADPETVFIALVQEALFHPVFAGVLLAAILAAIMSTADSQLLVCSSVLTEDIYRRLTRSKPDDRSLVWVGRLAVAAVALLAWYLALDPNRSVLNLVAYAWAGFGAAFGPAVLLSLHWPGINRWGGLAGILVGGLTVVIWKQLEGGWFDLYEIVPGFVLSTLAILVVSHLTRATR
ncbi:MAG: sodium/proline symporter PutP [Candidatus Pelagadaptatus aseana]|uniref:sodium/proline symporter PutP n=1 Tax=Candidatus Pelagadaptatus aseana TaxID=3120508 RepID=UPI0039B1F8E2